MDIREKYVIETENFRKWTDPKRSWKRTRVNIFEVQDNGEKKYLGNFERNYHSVFNTWEPFEQNGKTYALCAPDYTTTSVISLPDCNIVANEGGWDCFGFCPTGFYVPNENDDNVDSDIKNFANLKERFGFVCGCVWGDDSSWKIQFLDLSEIEQEKIIRDDRFGYVELDGDSSKLREAFEDIYILSKNGSDIDEIEIGLKGIRHDTVPLKRRVGKNQIDINDLLEINTKIIIGEIQYFLKKKTRFANVKDLNETTKKNIKRIVYNTIKEASGNE